MGLLWQIERPRSRWAAVAIHLPAALVSGVILLASALYRPGMIPFRTCAFFRLTGYPCVTCGYTRGFSGVAHGNWSLVWNDCPVVFVFFTLMALVFVWSTVAMSTGVILGRGRLLRGRWLAFYGIVLLALMLANWIYRLKMGFT